MKPNTVRILLLGIIIVAAFFRLYRLDTVPPGINRDEASIGYTAYSLMTTGKDEYGRSFPLSFESFGDWKLPLYIYTTIPFVAVFGLSELAVRLPSALAGTLTVLLMYFLVLELLNQSGSKRVIALLSAGLLAIMPWHIHISRVESEAIVSVLFTVAGSLLLLRSLRKKHLPDLIASAVLFAATYYTYHGSHITTTLILIGAFLMFRTQLYAIKGWWLALITGAVLTGSILSVTLGADHTKISGISIFGDPTVVHNNIEKPRLATGNPDALRVRLRYNRMTYAAETITRNYLASYGPKFLFVRGGGNRAHNIQGFGNLHPVEAPFLYAGIAILLSVLFRSGRTQNSRNQSFPDSGNIKLAKQASVRPMLYILWWFAAAGAASAITKDAPHSNRMLAVTPAMAIVASYGITAMLTRIRPNARTSVAVLIAACYVLSMTVYWYRYAVRFPLTEAGHWGYAYARLAATLESPEYRNKQIIMTHPQRSPYIYLVFYSTYPPDLYQKQAVRYPTSADGFTDVAGFGRFSFRPVDWETDLSRPDTVIVAMPEEIPDQYRPHRSDSVLLPDGTVQYMLISTDELNNL